MPNFVSPGALAGDAIQQQFMLREQIRRQQMREALEAQQIAEAQADRDADRKLREEQIRFQRNQAGLADMERGAAAADRQQRMQREQATYDRALSEQANARGMRQMIGDAMTAGPLTPDRARQISGMAIGEGIDVPAVIAQQAFPKPEADYTLNPGDIRFSGGKEIARGRDPQPRVPAAPRAVQWDYFIDPPTGRQIRINRADSTEVNKALAAGWRKLTSAAEKGTGLLEDDPQSQPAPSGGAAPRSAEELIRMYGGSD